MAVCIMTALTCFGIVFSDNRSDSIVVNATINSKLYKFMLDTASNGSLLSRDSLLSLTNASTSRFDVSLSVLHTYNIKFELADLREVNKAYENNGHTTIDGVIGLHDLKKIGILLVPKHSIIVIGNQPREDYLKQAIKLDCSVNGRISANASLKGPSCEWSAFIDTGIAETVFVKAAHSLNVKTTWNVIFASVNGRHFNCVTTTSNFIYMHKRCFAINGALMFKEDINYITKSGRYQGVIGCKMLISNNAYLYIGSNNCYIDFK